MNYESPKSLADAPVLVEIYRGKNAVGEPIKECVHRGLIVVTDGLGNKVFEKGDSLIYCHMRSCAKPLQILPLFEAQVFSSVAPTLSWLRDSDIPLMMSSHAGEPFHVARVLEMLSYMGLGESSLRCGAHPPLDDAARNYLICHNEPILPRHNNCSAKHVAMLLACQNLGLDMSSYEVLSHPLQQQIKHYINVIADMPNEEIYSGIDGCSLPSYAIPLFNVALIYARLISWQHHLPPDKPAFLSKAFARIISLALKYPEYLAGTHRFDTALIKASGNTIVSKTGADGMQSLAVLPNKKYPLGLGIAIKIADGDHKQTIRSLVTASLLKKLGLWSQSLESYMPAKTNYRGLLALDYQVFID